MEGLESTWALTSALMRLTGGEGGEGSWGLLGLDGRRPLRPFRLSVRTTAKYIKICDLDKSSIYKLQLECVNTY